MVRRHTCKQNTHTHKDRKKKTTLDVPKENLIPKESHARIRLKPASQTRNLSRRRGEQTVTLMPLVCYLSLSPWICLWVGSPNPFVTISNNNLFLLFYLLCLTGRTWLNSSRNRKGTGALYSSNEWHFLKGKENQEESGGT